MIEPIRFAPFEPGHLDLLAAVEPLAAALDRADAAATAATGFAWSGFVGDEIAGAGGITRFPNWPGRAHGWVIRTPALRRRDWPAVTAHARAVLTAAEASGLWRIEADVHPGFPAAARWAGRLGFGDEVLRRRCAPDGGDLWLFARVRED